MPTVDIDRDAARDAAQNELAKPIYPKASLSERLREWVADLLDRITSSAAALPGGWFTLLILVLLLVVAVVIAVRIARRTMHTRRGSDRRLFDDRQLSAAAYRATAERLATQGDWAAAIRHRLRAVARQLEETGVVDPVPGRTATELARDAGRSLPGLVDEFVSAANAFNDVTYGERPGTEAGYRLVAGLDDHLRSHKPTAGRPDAPVAAGSWAEVR